MIYAQSHSSGTRVDQSDVEGETPMLVIPEGRVPTQAKVGSQAVVGNVQVDRIDFGSGVSLVPDVETSTWLGIARQAVSVQKQTAADSEATFEGVVVGKDAEAFQFKLEIIGDVILSCIVLISEVIEPSTEAEPGTETFRYLDPSAQSANTGSDSETQVIIHFCGGRGCSVVLGVEGRKKK